MKTHLAVGAICMIIGAYCTNHVMTKNHAAAISKIERDAAIAIKDAAAKDAKKIKEAQDDAAKKIKTLESDLDDANAAADSLREQALLYARRADSAHTTNTPRASCTLLAQLLAQSDAAAGQYAKTAERALIAYEACRAAF